MIAVRILRDSAVVREQLFPAVPLTIGRGPECDVVLFDRTVSRLHARIDADAEGRLLLRDAGSRNGVRVGSDRVADVPGAPSIRCWVGGVLVEVEALSAEDTVELAAASVHELEQRRSFADDVRYAFVGVTGWVLLQVMDPDFWSPWQANRMVTALNHTLGAAVGIPVAAFVLLGILKAVGRRVRIADTLRAIAVVMGVLVAAQAVSFAAYYVATARGYGLADEVLTAALVVFVVTYFASVRRPPSRRFRIVWASVVAVLYLGLTATGRLAARRTGTPAVDHHVQVPLGTAGPSRAVEPYLARVGAATEAAARAAGEVRVRQGHD